MARNEYWWRVTAEVSDLDGSDKATVHITTQAGNEEYAGLNVKRMYDGSGLREKSDVKIISVELDR